MTSYVTATLQKLLLQSLALTSDPRSLRHPPRPGVDVAETMPMLFRSEGFAEDLSESHPSPA